jgi:pimeloyl-ACP methyl ester carboxylesterase
MASETLTYNVVSDTSARITMLVTDRATLPKLVAKRIVDGAGHFVPHEKSEAVGAALLDLLASTKDA